MKKLARSFEDAPIAGINIVPVIDLCLVLLVILLILSPLMDAPNLTIKLPEAKTKEEKENIISLSVTPDGKMALNTDLIEAGDIPKLLPVLLAEQGENTPVVIRADKNVTYGRLTDLLKTVKTAGAKRISLGTEQPKGAAQ
ncbi:MAG TPA: biopolymer transporter ExbD [Elusimicrobiota bacterium]|nr:biopolymer transporter ExbD [Elusimicrobiota bacterium]